jgi:hypothetical protein
MGWSNCKHELANKNWHISIRSATNDGCTSNAKDCKTESHATFYPKFNNPNFKSGLFDQNKKEKELAA